MKFRKILLLGWAVLMLAACSTMDSGNYRIKHNGVEYKATAISIIDEEEKIKYKDQSGKTHTLQGSFEVYED